MAKIIDISYKTLDEHQVRELNQRLADNAPTLTKVVIQKTKNASGLPVDASWIMRAINLEEINLYSAKNVLSDAMAEAIIKNDSIVTVTHGLSLEYNDWYSDNDYRLLDKIQEAISIRNSDCIQLGEVHAKFGQLAFNDFTHTWLPFDNASKRFKTQDLSYDESTKSFHVSGLSIPTPQGLRLTKIEVIKAKAIESSDNMKHESEYRQDDAKALSATYPLLLESLEKDPDNAETISELQRTCAVIGRHKKLISELNEKIHSWGEEISTKIKAQSELDIKFRRAFYEEELVTIQQLLAEGADLYARNKYGDTIFGSAEYWSKPYSEIKAFVLNLRDQEEAIKGAAAAESAAAGEDHASAAAGAGLDAAPLTEEFKQLDHIGDSAAQTDQF